MLPLVLSSTLFMIPAIRGFRKRKRLLPILNTATSLVSMNYWRNPTPGSRRQVDYLLAKTNFVIHHLYAKPCVLPLDLVIGGFWFLSNMGGKNWVRWHAAFHVASATGMNLIL